MNPSMLLLILVPLVSAAVVDFRPEENEVIGRSADSSGGWKLVSKVMSDCGSEDVSEVMNCLGVKAVAVLDRAARMGNIEVYSGVTLSKNTEVPEDGRNGRALLTETEITQSLPQDPTARTARVMDLLYDATVRFLQSHTLQFKLPQGAPESFSRALEEGRGKLKKKLFPIIALVGLKLFAVIPIILGVIGLVAAKALIVGKLALIISGIIALQKFLGQGGTSGFSYYGKNPLGGSDWSSGGSSAGWSTSGSAGSGGYTYRRSLEDEAQKLAYSAHVPEDETNAQ
ncbi:uncharacterized protein LOC124359692 [Homalodisca vitripennis]|uniref:uncharacterized protein LOC124359692 n=1 Tax=Homalodisca vitripennis TaxID=197043 RepID=UPI001EEBAE5D|nr:uncharacterized protein LOC124359692 [Homalodisca vitripennis]KAG8328202.1 hypothetical protein J6590_000859 [Homalodisca vitripennis]